MSALLKDLRLRRLVKTEDNTHTRSLPYQTSVDNTHIGYLPYTVKKATYNNV